MLRIDAENIYAENIYAENIYAENIRNTDGNSIIH